MRETTPIGMDNEVTQPSRSSTNSKSRASAIRAALVGTVVEYYDFGIYGYMATFVAALFFTSEDSNAALLGTFATFAVAFFLRAPGGIFFGHLGDKYGRKNALSWTILLMVFATALMGVIPTYATLGIWATVALVLARCLQGFAAGGELGGATVYTAETAPARWRATYTATVVSGMYIGSLVASLTALTLTAIYTDEQILAWAWRVPFLISVVLGITGFWIRRSMNDSPQFEQIEKKGETVGLPIIAVLRTSGSTVLKVALLGAVTTGGFYTASVYAVTYLKTVGGHSSTIAFLSTSICFALGILFLPAFGYMADRWGRKPVILAGSGFAICLAFPMFILMANGNPVAAIAGQLVLFLSVTTVLGAAFSNLGGDVRNLGPLQRPCAG